MRRRTKIEIPPWEPLRGVNYFPRHCLTADCAAWAVRTSIAFIDHVFTIMEIASPLDKRREYMSLE